VTAPGSSASARLLAAVRERGEDSVRLALEAPIKRHRIEVSNLAAAGPKIDNIAAPDALAANMVEA